MERGVIYRTLVSGTKKDLLHGKYRVNWAYICSAPHPCIRQHCICREEGLVLCLSGKHIDASRCRHIKTP
jgi:hypothetical protein